jgi:hypothetical protein
VLVGYNTDDNKVTVTYYLEVIAWD